MATSQSSLLEQVKQGNTDAITTALNHRLQPKGITAKASAKNACLHIRLESVKVPPQKPVVEFIQNAFAKVELNVWATVKVYGWRSGEDIPDWVEEFTLTPDQKQSTEELAKQGDIKAISMLLNQALQAEKIQAKVSLKGDCLQVMLEATEVPEQKRIVDLVKTEIFKLQVESIRKLKLYGKQLDEDFPDWHEDVDLSYADISKDSSEQESSNQDLQKSDAIVDGIHFSNQLYRELQKTCYHSLFYKVSSEEQKSIHQMVEDFIDELDDDLKSDIRRFSDNAIDIIASYGIVINVDAVDAILSKLLTSGFSGVKLAIRDLERTTREVLQTDFPKNQDFVQAFCAGFTGGFVDAAVGVPSGANSLGEAAIGATIGTILLPGLGTVVGGAIGGWFAGNKKQKALEAIIDRYYSARGELLKQWDQLLESFYDKLIELISVKYSNVAFLRFCNFREAEKFYQTGNEHLEKFEQSQRNNCNLSLEDSNCRDIAQAIGCYEKAISLNPLFVNAWNNKGYALNQLRRYEEAIDVLLQAIAIEPCLAMAFNNLGEALQNLERYEDAISAYQKSLEIESDNYSAWVELGSCFYEIQNYHEAIFVADKLIELQQDNFLGYYLKAGFQEIVGSTSALETLKVAYNLNPMTVQQLLADSIANSTNGFRFKTLHEKQDFQEMLESSVAMSYSSLKAYLQNRQWREADLETANLIREIIRRVTGSPEVTVESIAKFPVVDLNTIDKLWWTKSSGRYGFRVQKEIFASNPDRNAFGDRTGWRVRDAEGNYSWCPNHGFVYSNTAPIGHLPSGAWAGEDSWFQNRRDRLLALLAKLDLVNS